MRFLSSENPLVSNVKKYRYWTYDKSFESHIKGISIINIAIITIGIFGLLIEDVRGLVYIFSLIVVNLIILPFTMNNYKYHYRWKRRAFNINPDLAYNTLIKILRERKIQYEEIIKSPSKFLGFGIDDRIIKLPQYNVSIYMNSITTFINLGPIKADNSDNAELIRDLIDKALEKYVFQDHHFQFV